MEEDGAVVDGDNYGLLLRDPEGSSEETGVYGDAEAEEDTGASLDPEADRGSRRCRDAALGMPENLCRKFC